MSKQKQEIETALPSIGENIADDGLPTKPTSQRIDPQTLSYLFIAPPKFGKTTFFSRFPGSILLACEAGHKFVDCAKIIINGWEGVGHTFDTDGNICMGFVEACKRIVASERYKFVVIDTIDALAKTCSDHFLKLHKCESLKEMGDYGVGHDMGQNTPIRRNVGKILVSGRGVGYTTHQDIVKPDDDKTDKNGKKKREKKDCSMPNGLKKIIVPQVDLILHGELGGIRAPHRYRDRIIRTIGSEELLAGGRDEGSLPPAFITPHDPIAAWKQFEEFFSKPETVDATFKEYVELYGEL